MTIVTVGATKKYSDGWDTAFGKGKRATSGAKAKKSGSSKKKTGKSKKK